MTLPPDFVFSQQKLQDYLDCPQRFELRYLEQVAWPALLAEPARELERHLLLGSRFHQMVHRHRIGIPVETLERAITDPLLGEWWRSYLNGQPEDLPRLQFPEFTLTATLSGVRFVAKFDLLAVEPGKNAVIVDWKTGKFRPRRARIETRMQTRLYPLILVEAGAHLNGGSVDPDQVGMLYWYTASPHQPERFSYSKSAFHAGRSEVLDLIGQIDSIPAGSFRRATDERTCAYCNYRSLCKRGVKATAWQEAEDWEQFERGEFSLDFESIEPIPL